MTKTVKKQCVHPNCRKMRIPGGTTCKLHAGSNGVGTDLVVHAIDHVLRMTELESYKLAAMDAEMRNHLLAIQKQDLLLEKQVREFEAARKSLQEERKQTVAMFEIKNKAYQEYVSVLAEKYKLDPHKMSFDTDSQILRDLRNEAEETKG